MTVDLRLRWMEAEGAKYMEKPPTIWRSIRPNHGKILALCDLSMLKCNKLDLQDRGTADQRVASLLL